MQENLTAPQAGKKFHIKTFGCQMNMHDTERMASILTEQGYDPTDEITAADLVGPLAGQPLSALIDAIDAGNIYVNVHTNDFVDPPNTGAGDFPGGEIRGQVHEH